jgi:hypothetical protein
MQPTQELVDALYWEKVRRARASRPETKILEGPRLFDWACRIAMAGIRHQNPGASEDEVRALLRERLAIGERLERSQ